MTLEQFININREDIIQFIRNSVPNNPDLDDEIESWIMNDERLYDFAIVSGVAL